MSGYSGFPWRLPASPASEQKERLDAERAEARDAGEAVELRGVDADSGVTAPHEKEPRTGE